MRYAFAGDRAISLNILRFLKSQGCEPSVLLVSVGENASHADELIKLSGLNAPYILHGNEFKQPISIKLMESLELDYLIGIHFPYLVPTEILKIPKIGVLNLHPAFLPYNKGWHTPSWAIIENQPYGATLHFMEEALDQGDIVHQKELIVYPYDTANTLYQRAMKLEEEVFFEAFTELLSLNPSRYPQSKEGSSHLKKDLFSIKKIDLNKQYTGQELIDKLRALTTNDLSEAVYFEKDGKKISVQVIMQEIIE